VTFDQITTTNIVGNGLQTDQSSTFTLSNLNMTIVCGSGVVLNNTPSVSVDNSTFTTVSNVISYLIGENNISGTNNAATGFNTLFTGTTTGGFIQFTTPNATAP
jgi:hypothetical protein